MRLVLGPDFPDSPPKGYFMTRIFHPNISNSGEICVNVLKKDWAPDLGLRHVLVIVRCLLIQPFPDSALNEEAGKLLMEDYQEYAKHAQLMTSIHAQPQKQAGLSKQKPTADGEGVSSAHGSGSENADQGGEGLPLKPLVEKALNPKADGKRAKAAVMAKKKSLKRL
jgi:ubiquitin-conjugating enzyme E2 S